MSVDATEKKEMSPMEKYELKKEIKFVCERAMMEWHFNNGGNASFATFDGGFGARKDVIIDTLIARKDMIIDKLMALNPLVRKFTNVFPSFSRK